MKLLYFFLGFIFLGFFVFYPVKKDGKLLPGRISGKIIVSLEIISFIIDTILKLNGVFFFVFLGIDFVLAGAVSDIVYDYVAKYNNTDNERISKLKRHIVITIFLIILAILSIFIGIKYNSLQIYIYCIIGIIILQCILFRIF